MPKWHFGNRNHPGKGWAAQDGSCQWAWLWIWFWSVCVIFQVSLGLCLQSVLPDESPTAADRGIHCPQAPHWAFAAPRAATGPHCRMPDPARVLLEMCWGWLGAACCCLPALFFWVMPQPAPVLLCRCLRAGLSFQLSQYTVRMPCKTASVAEHAALGRNTVK